MIKINFRKISRHKSGDPDSRKRNNSTEWLADKIYYTIIKRTLFRNILLGIVVFPLILMSLGCDDSEDDDDELIGNWFELSDFEGTPRSGAVVFCINDKAYIGTGYDGTDRLNDFWRYDPRRNLEKGLIKYNYWTFYLSFSLHEFWSSQKR